MAQSALLLGVKGDTRTIIAQGDPREMRKLFKVADDGQGYDQWEVLESAAGRTRKKAWKESASESKPTPKKAKA